MLKLRGMSKLAWVALPLLLAVAIVLLLALRDRPPGRTALNVWSSVLLLVYLAATAGLGIFWVANQHLPVFDWHYLFGYATVLLLVVHLGFNFRVVWRHAVRWRRGAAGATSPTAAPVVASTRPASAAPRRTALLVTLGSALTAVGAYWLGLRHGRTELRVASAAAGAVGSGAAPDVQALRQASLAFVEEFHEFSAHSRRGVFRRAPGIDWGDAPPPFKAWPGATELALPAPLAGLRAPAGAASLTLPVLATLLHAGAGVNLVRGGIHFRCAPSSGALFASELYVQVLRVAGLAPGRYHYDGRAHRLHRLPDAPGVAEPHGAHGAPAAPAALLFASAVFRRSGHKYRDRAYRYILADLGHLLENVRAAAAALGTAAAPIRLFDEAAAARALGLDEAEEGVLAVWALGGDAVQARSSIGAADPAAGGGWRPAPLTGAAALGVTDAIHRATSLRASPAASSPAPPHAAPPVHAQRPARGSGSGTIVALPAPTSSPMPALERIARRRSRRRTSRAPLTLAQLSALLDAMARGVGPLLSTAVRIDVLSAAVQGLPQAAWRYEPAPRWTRT